MTSNPPDAPPAAPAPAPRARLRALTTALGIGTVGGAIFAALHLPLAWMMGAMVATTIAALSGVRPMHVPPSLRSAMIAILGVLLGSQFTPELLGMLDRWVVTIAAVLFYILTAAAVTLLYFRMVSKDALPTQYFSSIPGGFTEMILMGGAMGGDERKIALMHSSRVLLIIMTIPLWFQWFGGYDPLVQERSRVYFLDVPPVDLLVLAASAVVGHFAGMRLRIPAGNLVGPMVVSAVLHVAGVTGSTPPFEAVAVAQVVVGASIGGRFLGVTVREISRLMVMASGATVAMLGVTLLFTFGLHALTGLSAESILLAFAPGGLAEMSLVALALDIDAAFVSTHHIVRIILVVALAPLAYRLVSRWLGVSPKPPAAR